MLLATASQTSVTRGDDLRALLQVIDRYEALVKHLLDQQDERRYAEAVAAATSETGLPLGDWLADTERRLILACLEACHGNRSLAASRLGLRRQTLHDRLVTYGVAAQPAASPPCQAPTALGWETTGVPPATGQPRCISGCGRPPVPGRRLCGFCRAANASRAQLARRAREQAAAGLAP